MKKISLLFFTFVCLNVIFAQPTDDQIRQAATTLGVPFADLKQFVLSYQTASSTDAILIDAVSLSKEYKENRIRADNQYKGKTLKIKGVIDGIYNTQLSLRGVSASDYITIYFKPTELSKIANLNKGQTVTFIGICDSTSTYVNVKDAILVPN